MGQMSDFCCLWWLFRIPSFLEHLFFSMWEKDFFFSQYGYSVDPAPFIEIIILSSLHWSVTFVTDHVTVCVCLFLDILFLTYLSNFVLASYSFNCFNFIIGHDICILLALFFISRLPWLFLTIYTSKYILEIACLISFTLQQRELTMNTVLCYFFSPTLFLRLSCFFLCR